MSATNLKEKLENNSCHIHNQQPMLSILDNGKLKVNTCCILFNQQLNMLVEEQEQQLMD